MKVIGIIAEYNPFHNGHAYQIEAIRRRYNADYVVVAMSGDFVQRGAPAIMDKYARTKMALSCGADLIIELPVLWATASAELFAMAGVTLFEKMGCVDGICFGAETNDLPLLTAIADILKEEPKAYRSALSSHLKKGVNFPLARTRAVCDYLTAAPYRHAAFFPADRQPHPRGQHDMHTGETVDAEIIAAVLNEPNNILAIEYLKALKRRGSGIAPFLLKREGAGYHDATISDAKNTPAASATAIRHILTASAPCYHMRREQDSADPALVSAESSYIARSDTIFDRLAAAMPAPALAVLKDYFSEYLPVYANDFSSVLGYQLLSGTPKLLASTADCNTDIANRLFRNRYAFRSFESFCERNKSKDITYTRLSRIFLHLILGISNQDYAQGKNLDYIPYLRVLGFRKDSTPLLSRLKETAAVPILSKLADASGLLAEDAYALLEKDIFASELYAQMRMIRSAEISPGYGGEFRQPVIIL